MKERDAMQDIRECWAKEIAPGAYYFRDPVLDHPELDKAPATPAPESEEDPESLI